MIGYVSVEEQVEKDFDRALLKASLHRLRNHLRRRDGAHERLLSFEEAKGALVQWTQAYRGMRTVEVEKITGSVGRWRDFDGSFLPLKKSMGERWSRIDRAYHKGDELPAVSLYKIGDAYFVRNGNHRVSVAKYHKVATIDAEVVELRGHERTDAVRPAAPSREEAGAETGEAAHDDGLAGAHERRDSGKQVSRQDRDLPRPSREKKGARPMTIKGGAQLMTITTNSKEAWRVLEGRSRVTAALGLVVAAFVVAAFMLLGASSPAHASTTFTVTNTTDANNVCDAGCSLREAITAANATP